MPQRSIVDVSHAITGIIVIGIARGLGDQRILRA